MWGEPLPLVHAERCSRDERIFQLKREGPLCVCSDSFWSLGKSFVQNFTFQTGPRRAAIFPPLTWYHSAMNAVPAGVFVTISYNTQTSLPSTNVFLTSILWIIEASLLLASRY